MFWDDETMNNLADTPTPAPRPPGRPRNATRADVVERMRAGESRAAIAKATGVSSQQLSKWWKAENAGPRGVPPPTKDKPPAYKSSGGRRPITESTAGMLVAGLFTIAAIRDGETWLLTQTERDGMAGPLADSMRTLPTPIADAINTYSAPVTFLSAIATVVAHKITLRNEAKKKLKPNTIMGAVPPPPPTNGAPRTVPFVAPTPAARNGAGAGGPFVERAEPSLAEAIDAARSNLSALDGRDDAETFLG